MIRLWIAQLLRRAGFGATPAELARYQKMGYRATLDELLHPEKIKQRRPRRAF